MTVIIDNKQIKIEIEGDCSKRDFNIVKRQLNNLLQYIEQGNKKTYIVAEIDNEDNTADRRISTYLFNEEIDIIIRMNIFNNIPMYIKCISHTFIDFQTDFLKTTSSTTLEIPDKNNWSPAISLGVLGIKS